MKTDQQIKISKATAARGGKAPKHILGGKRHGRNINKKPGRISHTALKKISFKAGVPSISPNAIELILKMQRLQDLEVMKNAITMCDSARRKKLTAIDIQHGIELIRGPKVYG